MLASLRYRMNRKQVVSKCILIACAAFLASCRQDLSCNANVSPDRIQSEFRRVSADIAGHDNVGAEVCLGELAFRQGNFNVAAERDRRALALARSDRDRSIILQRLASALKYLGHAQEAIDLLEQAIHIDEAHGYRAASATAYATLASAYGDTGDHVRSIQMSLTSLPGLTNRSSVAATYNNIAMEFMRLRQFDSAYRYIDMSIDVDASSGDLHEMGIHEINKGIIFNSAAMYLEASFWLRRGIEQSRRSGDDFWVMQGEAALGQSLYQLGRVLESIDAYTQAAGLAHRLGQGRLEVAYKNMGRSGF